MKDFRQDLMVSLLGKLVMTEICFAAATSVSVVFASNATVSLQGLTLAATSRIKDFP